MIHGSQVFDEMLDPLARILVMSSNCPQWSDHLTYLPDPNDLTRKTTA